MLCKLHANFILTPDQFNVKHGHIMIWITICVSLVCFCLSSPIDMTVQETWG